MRSCGAVRRLLFTWPILFFIFHSNNLPVDACTAELERLAAQASAEDLMKLRRLQDMPPYFSSRWLDTELFFPPHFDPNPSVPEVPNGVKAVVFVLAQAGGGSSGPMAAKFSALKRHGLGVVVLEWPFHGENGPRDQKYLDSDELLSLVSQGIKHVREAGVPVFLFTYSQGTIVAQEMALRGLDAEVAHVFMTGPSGWLTPDLREITKKHLGIDKLPPGVDWIEHLHSLGWRISPEAARWELGPDGSGFTGVLRGFRSIRDMSAIPSRVPRTIFIGDSDDYCPVDKARDFASRFPDANFEPIEGADHNNILATPRKGMNPVMRKVLERIGLVLNVKLEEDNSPDDSRTRPRFLAEQSTLFSLWCGIRSPVGLPWNISSADQGRLQTDTLYGQWLEYHRSIVRRQAEARFPTQLRALFLSASGWPQGLSAVDIEGKPLLSVADDRRAKLVTKVAKVAAILKTDSSKWKNQDLSALTEFVYSDPFRHEGAIVVP